MTSRKKGFIEPGFLVVGDVGHNGCASYSIDSRKEKKKGNIEEAEWHTQKTIKNVKEHKEVKRVRRMLSRMISTLGAHVTGFGYLVPLERAKELEKVLAEIEKQVGLYNNQAKDTRLDSTFAVFEIAATNDRVAVALFKRTVELLDRVSEAIAKGSVVELRRALRKMKGLDAVMPKANGESVGKALKKAREAAKKAVKETKDMDDTKAIAKAKKMFKDVPIDAVRAEMVEIAEKASSSAKKTPILAPVDARQVEG